MSRQGGGSRLEAREWRGGQYAEEKKYAGAEKQFHKTAGKEPTPRIYGYIWTNDMFS